jgi:hypothetical protein
MNLVPRRRSPTCHPSSIRFFPGPIHIMRNLSSLKKYFPGRTSKKRLSTTNHGARRPLIELLEARNMFAVASFPGNAAPPDLDLSAIVNQTVTVGQPLTVNLFTAGATIEDLDAEGDPTGDTIRYYLDPDVGTDTPVGASLTSAGVFTWTPTATQVGTHKIVVIAVDSGTPALADAETFTVVVSAATPPAVVDLNGADAGIDFASTFIEDGGPVTIVDTDLTVTDTDDTNLESATITLTNRPDEDDESLAVTTTGTAIVATYNPTTGILALAGTDTVANYQQVLRTLKYNNLSQAPDTTARTVQIIANDGTSNSTTAVATVTIQGVNDTPSVDLNGTGAGTGFEATFTEDGAPVAIVGATAVIGDVDSANLSSATITITNLLDGAAELLAAITTGTAITANYVAATGILTLTGSDSLTSYQQVLRTLTYANSSQNPTTTARLIQVVVNDGTNNSTARTSTVSIVAANDAPALAVITDQNATVGVPFQLTVTATDPENDTLTYQIDRTGSGANAPASAIITKNNNNEAVITWTPTVADGAGPFTFVILVTDDDSVPLTDSEDFIVTIVTAPPSVDANGDGSGIDFAATFTENPADGDAVAIVDTDLAVTDSDSTTLASATVTITNLQNGADESLAATTTGTAITANYVSAATGVLTLSGVDSLANYQQVLRTLLYNNTSQDPGEVARIITIVANDGANNSAAATATVNVTVVNSIPNLILPAPYNDEATPIVVTLGDEIEFTATATDVDHTLAELIFYLDPESSELPGSVIQPDISIDGDFLWTADSVGTFIIRIFVSDNVVGSPPNSETFTINVVAPAGLAASLENSALDAGIVDSAFESLG